MSPPAGAPPPATTSLRGAGGHRQEQPRKGPVGGRQRLVAGRLQPHGGASGPSTAIARWGRDRVSEGASAVEFRGLFPALRAGGFLEVFMTARPELSPKGRPLEGGPSPSGECRVCRPAPGGLSVPRQVRENCSSLQRQPAPPRARCARTTLFGSRSTLCRVLPEASGPGRGPL